ncbi:periplasmic heavy metal sensor [Phaeobacter gallaeciensis]|uniref:Integral membrane protein n=1 Tax=Phaeobacter gallaeciensis TaxID=60890 RepID=A0AAC9ZAD2_9RHOB|nr:periplasmic heavy metal sensor [Phaeobacter gallaeciensis]AHD10374.1 putative integral membrane protein [Phaeobacter gallaeciensis DSM 26640]ATE93638.1 putative integral membrane protein [Phaeobacter gallaeciensis]ATE96541.1 putative integral membrane protein [Phaeobacter gallaeciensis]ATF02302.1 putative integral membrane protein [Phaeobacter gallaeciensis]ATF06682.1 putative integral membrane protein [Phaeobacter gallaeciensis]
MTNETRTSKPGRRLRWLLMASLALNLAVVGVVAGAAWRFNDHKRGAGMPPPVGALLFRDLDAETRRGLRNTAEGEHGSYKGRRRAEGGKVVELLRASPFDATALGGMLEAQATRRHEFQRSVQAAWLDQIVAMTADERAAYADQLEQRIQHPKRRNWRR